MDKLTAIGGLVFMFAVISTVVLIVIHDEWDYIQRRRVKKRRAKEWADSK